MSKGIYNPSKTKNLKIQLNPFKDDLFNETKDFQGAVHVNIVDVLGKQVWQANILLDSQSQTIIQPTGLQQGPFYTLSLKDQLQSSAANHQMVRIVDERKN